MQPTCLIGEADPFIFSLLRRFSEALGLGVLHARSGQELLHLAHHVRPALIIVEPELPGKVRGWDAIRQLAADPATQATPMITCSWMSATDASSLVGHASGHLQKPELHFADFVAVIAESGVDVSERAGAATGDPLGLTPHEGGDRAQAP